MSTLISTRGIPTQRRSSSTDGFEALARAAYAAPEAGGRFDTVFDLDYGQTALERAEEAELARRAAARAARAPGAPGAEPKLQPGPSAVPRVRIRRRAVRLTRRGRATLTLVFLGLVLAVTLPLSGWATATLDTGDPAPVRVVQVQPGDTLYGIAGELAEPGEVRAMVHRIQELNSLPGSAIVEGQTLAVPAG